MALEIVYRLNVGGRSISPKENTGMFRQWFDSTGYLLSEGVNPRLVFMTLNYSCIDCLVHIKHEKLDEW